jgi:hypothetical protein
MGLPRVDAERIFRARIEMDQEEHIETLEREFPTVSGSAFAAARAQALAAGHSVVESDEGCIYEVFPDGHRVLVKKIAAPLPVVPGSVITIW